MDSQSEARLRKTLKQALALALFLLAFFLYVMLGWGP